MVTKYKTDGGLTVLLEPIESVVSISVGLWIKAGSRHEKSDEFGYAHFVEHMLFKGTKNHSAMEIAQIVDRVGGQHNAATNREYTCYFINVISDYLESSIGLLSDMYYNSLFSTDELEKEKNVILEEIRMYEDAPDDIIHDIFMASMLSSHPLGHSILGTIESVKNSSREKLLRFFKRYYNNNQSIIAIAGNFKEEKAKNLIDKYFQESIVRNPEIIQDTISPKRTYRQHVDKDLEQVHFCMGTEGLKWGDADRWTLFILSTVLGGSMSSRLFQSIREREGLCYSIYSFHSSYSDNGIFGIYCGTSPANYKRSLELIIRECEILLKNGITSQELEDVKTYIKGNLALSLESTEIRMCQLAKNEMAHNRYYSFNDIEEKIDSVTLSSFNRVCTNIFMDKRFTIVSIGKLDSVDENELYLNV